MSLQSLRALQNIQGRTVHAPAATPIPPDSTRVLLMAVRVTPTLLTEPLLLRVTSMVVMLPHIEATKVNHMERTTQPPLTTPLVPAPTKDEAIGAMDSVEGALVEHIDKRHRAIPITLEVTTTSTD